MKDKIIFLKKEYSEQIEYCAIYESKVEKMNYSDTYGDFGRKVSSYDAGDCIELLSERAVNYVRAIKNSNIYNIGDSIYAYNDKDLFESFFKSNLIDGLDFSVVYTECYGFNYWDGNNWKTILLSHDYLEYFEWKVIRDKDLIKNLRTAIIRKEEKRKGVGYVDYEFGKYIITESFWSGSWEMFKITLKDERQWIN